jgi:hypothetical protein
MKQTELQQIIKEEILKEIKVNSSAYVMASPEYKKFYQMIELNEYWGIDWEGGGYSVDFNDLAPNDFLFFYFINSFLPSDQMGPNKCIISVKNLEEGFMNWGIEDDPDAQQHVIDMIKANR